MYDSGRPRGLESPCRVSATGAPFSTCVQDLMAEDPLSQTPVEKLINRIHNSDKAVWVFCGDSITHGALHTQGARDYVELVEERVRYELARPLHLFANTAISGNTTAHILDQFGHRVERFKPDAFSLMIGMNDSARIPIGNFRNNLRQIVNRVRESCGSDVLLHTCCAIHPEQCRERAAYPEFMDAVREAAAELATALIDHHAAWERTRLENRRLSDSWMANEFHPNEIGHWVFADRILKELNLGPLEKVTAPAKPA